MVTNNNLTFTVFLSLLLLSTPFPSNPKLLENLVFLRDKVGLSTPQLTKLIQKKPNSLSISPIQLKATHDYFTLDLKLSSNQFQRLILSFPQIFAYSIPNNLVPTVTYLTQTIGFSAPSLTRSLTRYPQLLSLSVDQTYLPKIQFLEQHLHLNRKGDVLKVMKNFPPIVWLSFDNLLAKIEFFSTPTPHGCGLHNPADLRSFVLAFPQVLGLSTDNLQQTVRFYHESGLGTTTKNGLSGVLSSAPHFLAYSIPRRLNPRKQRMLEHGIEVKYSSTKWITDKDEVFDRYLDQLTADFDFHG